MIVVAFFVFISSFFSKNCKCNEKKKIDKDGKKGKKKHCFNRKIIEIMSRLCNADEIFKHFDIHYDYVVDR